MSVCSIEFLLAILALAVLIPLLPGPRTRGLALAVANVWFLAAAEPNLPSLVALAALLLSGYACASWLRERPNSVLLVLYLLALLAAFVIVKRYQFLGLLVPAGWLQHPVAILGLSYMLFRQIHFIVDSMQGQVERPSLWVYLNYQLNLFAISAGPIQRYQTFREDWDTLRPLPRDLHEGLRTYVRIFLGMVKVVIIAPPCLAWYERMATYFETPPVTGSGSWLRVVAKSLVLLYSYPMFIYFNFSGYCDVVIGAARLSGLRLPENFDSPFLARNMIEYWTRWHRTLGFWIRDYVFTPMYKALVERWPRRARRSRSPVISSPSS